MTYFTAFKCVFFNVRQVNLLFGTRFVFSLYLQMAVIKGNFREVQEFSLFKLPCVGGHS